MIDPLRPPLYRHIGCFSTPEAAASVASAFAGFHTRTVATAGGYRLERESTPDELDERDRVLIMRVVADAHPAPKTFTPCDADTAGCTYSGDNLNNPRPSGRGCAPNPGAAVLPRVVVGRGVLGVV